MDKEKPMRTQQLRTRTNLPLLALVIAGTALGGSVSAQSRRDNGVTVYTNTNFGGQSATIRDDTPNLVPLGLNDRIVSIRIPDGEAWEVCQDADYGNQCQTLTSSISDLRSMGWGNRISSMRRVSSGGFGSNGGFGRQRYPGAIGTAGTTGVTVYTNPNFRGQSATLNADTPNLVQYGLNDKISSIQIPNGESWEVCTDVDYGNGCQVLTGSVSDLGSMGWGDRISSLRRVSSGNRRFGGGVGTGGSNVSQGLVFYGRPGFQGASRVVTSANTNVGWAARSIQVRGGGPWELCDNRGQCATVNQDVPDVSQLGLTGRITSVRPLPNSRWRR
jgi:hypothetical protein